MRCFPEASAAPTRAVLTANGRHMTKYRRAYAMWTMSSTLQSNYIMQDCDVAQVGMYAQCNAAYQSTPTIHHLSNRIAVTLNAIYTIDATSDALR